MPPQTVTFFYFGLSKRQMQKILQNVPGTTKSCIIPLYADKQLTKKIGSLKYELVLLDNTQLYPVVSTNYIITTQDGTIHYEVVKNNYKPLTVETEQTSGIYTKGTITRTYVTGNKEIRKLVYTSFT